MTAVRGLRVLGGRFVSLQDAGRRGQARFGVGVGGPMDPLTRLVAVGLAGVSLDDADDVPVVEVGPDGTRLRAEGGAVTVSVAGPGAVLAIDGVTVAAPAVVRVEDGLVLAVSGARWSAVCPVDEVLAPRVLGSVSWHGRTGLGTSLRPGALLPLGSERAEAPRLGTRRAPPPSGEPLLVLPGPQTHLFDDEARAALVGDGLVVAPVGDRMAQRLDGVRVHARGGHDIVSDGAVAGAIQVQGDGAPWVLCAEHQPTGGYPKIGVLAVADRGRLAQLGPGEPVRLRWGTVDEARARWSAALAAIERCVSGPVTPTSDRLLGAAVEGAGHTSADP